MHQSHPARVSLRSAFAGRKDEHPVRRTGPVNSRTGPLTRGPLKGPRSPLKGPRGPLKGPWGRFKGPRGGGGGKNQNFRAGFSVFQPGVPPEERKLSFVRAGLPAGVAVRPRGWWPLQSSGPKRPQPSSAFTLGPGVLLKGTPGSFKRTPGSFKRTPGSFTRTPGSFKRTPGSFKKTQGSLKRVSVWARP